MKETLSPRRVWLARIIAMAVDALQVGAFPFFFEGVLSPANDILDVVTSVIMVTLLGWHWAFLPTLLAEIVPAVNLFPTWTAAVFFATWGGPSEPTPVPPRTLRAPE